MQKPIFDKAVKLLIDGTSSDSYQPIIVGRIVETETNECFIKPEEQIDSAIDREKSVKNPKIERTRPEHLDRLSVNDARGFESILDVFGFLNCIFHQLEQAARFLSANRSRKKRYEGECESDRKFFHGSGSSQ